MARDRAGPQQHLHFGKNIFKEQTSDAEIFGLITKIPGANFYILGFQLKNQNTIQKMSKVHNS